MGTVIRIDPHALYSRADLDEMLRPMGIDVDGWIAKVRPVRRFRLAYWGGDLIRAIEATPALGSDGAGIDSGGSDRKRERGSEKATGSRGGRRRAKEIEAALAPLERLMRGTSERP